MEKKLTSLKHKTEVVEDTFTAMGVEVLSYSMVRSVHSKCDTHVLIELADVGDGWDEEEVFKIGLTLLDGDGEPIFVGKRPAAECVGFYNAYDIVFFLDDDLLAHTAKAKIFAAKS